MTAGRQPGVVAAQLVVAAELALREVGEQHVRIVGIGWATVELDRAAAQLAASLGLPAGAWVPGSRDTLLGAASRLGPPLTPDGPRLILLEPDTEGRLAASLVRLGEGIAAVYVTDERGIEAPGGATAELSPAGTGNLGRLEPGPLGPARLAVGGPAWGPHILVVDRDLRLDDRTTAEGRARIGTIGG